MQKGAAADQPSPPKKRTALTFIGATTADIPPTKKFKPVPLTDEQILQLPVKNGSQTQQDITNMFMRQGALDRKRKADSAARRLKLREEDHYSNLRATMTPEKHQENKEKLLKERADSKASARAAHADQKQKRKDADIEKAKEERLRRAIDGKNQKKAKKIFDDNYAQVFKTLMKNPGQLEKRLKKDLRNNFAAPKKTLHFEGEVIELLSLKYVPGQYEYFGTAMTRIIKIFPHFQGLKMKDPIPGSKPAVGTVQTEIVPRLNPEWVKDNFDGVYVQMVMMEPSAWWPVVIGSHRDDDKDAPEALVVKAVYLKYPQHDLDHCLSKGMASCLFYCGEKEAAQKLSRVGSQFLHLTKPVAVAKLRDWMTLEVPSIGGCEILSRNAKAKKNDNKTGITITDLVETKTCFPTLVIPIGKDGSNNHAVVVIDDLIFDSTQEFALKLCRESLDWICGEGGIASINTAIRFNRSTQKKLVLKHQPKTNW
jgi:hypothetical protein